MTADAKLEAFQSLLGEVSAGLAEIVESFSTRQTSADEMASALADIHSAIENHKAQPLTELVAAIQSLRIQAPAVTVTNQVQPTPIQNHMPQPLVQILERVQPREYKVHSVVYDNHDRLQSAVISPVERA